MRQEPLQAIDVGPEMRYQEVNGAWDTVDGGESGSLAERGCCMP